MKVRVGFVSNSSSSSYVIIAPSEFNPFEVFEDQEERELMERAIKPHKTKVLGQDAHVYELNSADEGCYAINEAKGFEELAEKNRQDIWEYDDYLFNKLVKSFKDNKDCYVNCDYR